jgi:hypothetical protein
MQLDYFWAMRYSSGDLSPVSHRGRPGFDHRSGHVGFVVEKVALGQVFSENFGCPCKFSFYQLLHTDLSSGAGAISQLVADIPSGLSHLTP